MSKRPKKISASGDTDLAQAGDGHMHGLSKDSMRRSLWLYIWARQRTSPSVVNLSSFCRCSMAYVYIYIHMTICSLLLFFLPTFSREEQECTVPVASVESTGQAVCFVTSVHYALVCLNPVFGDQLRSPKV